MKNKKLKYKVIIESSVIYGKPIRKEVSELIKNSNNNKNLNINFFVPELVFEESKKHLLEDYLEAKLKYETITKELSILLIKKFKKIQCSKKYIFNIVTKSYAQNKIRILRTPITQIDWKNLLSRSVFKELPFGQEKDKEKGFKDAVIAETILKYLPKLAKDANVAMLIADSLLSDYLKMKTKRFRRVKIFSSVPDFESALRLHLLENDDKLNEEISRQAEEAFYSPLDKMSLFYREEFPKKITEKFPTLFANPKIGYDLYYSSMVWNETRKTNWIPISEPEYRVSKPVFIKKENSIYHWESTVIYRQLFENEAYHGYSAYLGGFDNKGEHSLEFKVFWDVSTNNRGIIDPLLAKITNIEYISRDHSPALALSYGVSGATEAGQGTVPVVNPSASESASPSVSPSISISPSLSPSKENDSDL